MNEFGFYCVTAALVVAAYAFLVSALAGKRADPVLAQSGENALIGSFVLIALASASLISLLIHSDFNNEYVASYTSLDLPLHYKVTAFWGGQTGSLLFWTLLLSVFTVVVVFQNQAKNRELMPYVCAALAVVQSFFLAVLTFVAPPFATLGAARPADGTGLNPLLQNYWMVVHPPHLYLGFVGFTVPFAFGVAALVSNNLNPVWIKTTRRWTLVAWLFLTMGIFMGAHWAYLELGWGGYWAWDPVENASFMPWLLGTAFLHSVMVQEKKGMLKVWNLVLIILTFEMCLFGTFLTRSGVVSSVHSFAQSNIGSFFVAFIGGSLGISFYFLFRRLQNRQLEPEQRLTAFFSRESSFLFNNLLFLGIAFAVFWGTVFPIVSEAVRGVKVSVSIPFFNNVTLPVAFALLALTGVCPLIAWRKASVKNFNRNFLYPLIAGIATIPAAMVFGVMQPMPLLFFAASVFVLATVVWEFWKGTRARQAARAESEQGESWLRALYLLVATNKRRYGGFIIHAGVVLVFVGIIGSSFFRMEQDFVMRQGETARFKNYSFTFQSFGQRREVNKEVSLARVDLFRNGKKLATMRPEKHFHFKGEQPQTEVDILSQFDEDFYIVLVGWDDKGAATFKIYINPLVSWIWFGGFVMALGTLFVMMPNRQRRALARTMRQEVRHAA
ncbi:MAG: heme lyase CcmF/NrfE family subunit [Acidobacteria bacterium]|nr:heme lyase CcmF/NrfE family subunit [Acidobacteriota bacterium]